MSLNVEEKWPLVRLQTFDHLDEEKGRRITISMTVDKATWLLLVDDYGMYFDIETGDFKGSRRINVS